MSEGFEGIYRLKSIEINDLGNHNELNSLEIANKDNYSWLHENSSLTSLPNIK